MCSSDLVEAVRQTLRLDCGAKKAMRPARGGEAKRDGLRMGRAAVPLAARADGFVIGCRLSTLQGLGGLFRMSRNRACADIGSTAGSASGGQNSGLCIGRGRKSALCIGFGREPGPFPPRRDAPARPLSQKASSRARLRFAH